VFGWDVCETAINGFAKFDEVIVVSAIEHQRYVSLIVAIDIEIQTENLSYKTRRFAKSASLCSGCTCHPTRRRVHCGLRRASSTATTVAAFPSTR